MNTRDLEYLVAVAEELHFGRAAARCNASQPALSGQLRKLEDRLGVTLFERSKRHVRLTAIGEDIVSRAQEILRQVDGLEKAAKAFRDPYSGRLTIGMPPTIGPYLTPLLLMGVRHYLPNIRLELIEDFTDSLETQLTDGAIDLAVLATRPTQSTLSEILLYDEPFWVALPNRHPMTVEETVDLDALDARELLLLSDGHCLRDQIYDACKIDRRGAGEGPRTQKTSLSTILSLVGAGQGVTLVPAMSLSGGWMTDSGIAVRPERSGDAGRTVRLTYREGYARMELVERLARVIVAIVPNTVRARRR